MADSINPEKKTLNLFGFEISRKEDKEKNTHKKHHKKHATKEKSIDLLTESASATKNDNAYETFD